MVGEARHPAHLFSIPVVLSTICSILALIIFLFSPGCNCALTPCQEVWRHSVHWTNEYSDVDEVVPGIMVGNICFAGNLTAMKAANVTHVVPAASEWGVQFPGEFHYFDRVSPLSDGDDFDADYFKEGVAFILENHHEPNVILVHCNMGISRSTTMVVMALAKDLRISNEQALEMVREKRPFAMPNTYYMRMLHDEL